MSASNIITRAGPRPGASALAFRIAPHQPRIAARAERPGAPRRAPPRPRAPPHAPARGRPSAARAPPPAARRVGATPDEGPRARERARDAAGRRGGGLHAHGSAIRACAHGVVAFARSAASPHLRREARRRSTGVQRSLCPMPWALRRRRLFAEAAEARARHVGMLCSDALPPFRRGASPSPPRRRGPVSPDRHPGSQCESPGPARPKCLAWLEEDGRAVVWLC